ncbi:hypothetical protein ACFS5L_40530 [Streptomyces phyllanthi]|uniref:Uncharacterized protein n=1 Tax=Streptomyces phyllanthi TaxID=1803180 RepID=A0A5N8VUP6_9ACTN|nr:hypothetical protein [Streptomyces phyllanthi]MPY39001.1 hypothetical protein [Streptomyces phyllanthi]
MAIMSLDPTRKGRAHWTSRWKTALNSFVSPSTAGAWQLSQPADTRSHPVGPAWAVMPGTDRRTVPTSRAGSP